MCGLCEAEATAAANRTAAPRSTELKGHGRGAHGRDAGYKKKVSEASRQKDADSAWQKIYDQTYNRVVKDRHG